MQCPKHCAASLPLGLERMAVLDCVEALVTRSQQAWEVLVVVFDMYLGIVKDDLALKERDLMCDGFLFQIHVFVVGDSKA